MNGVVCFIGELGVNVYVYIDDFTNVTSGEYSRITTLSKYKAYVN
jgi:hypothetical protein